MTDYVKIIDGLPQFPPKNKGSILNYDINIEMLIEDGYKEFVPAEIPETIRMYHFDYVETDVITEIVVYDETKEEAEEREAQQRRAHIDSLTCTKRVFALILEQVGVTYTQLKQLISTSERAQLEWDLCIELLRANPLLDVFAEQLGISPGQIDNIFLYANGEISAEQLVIPTEEPEDNGEK